MTFRKTLFWMHLTAGVTAGLVVALLSLTGAILAFEPQILAAKRNAAVSDAAPLDLDALVLAARAAGAADGATLTPGDGTEIVTVQAGRQAALLLDPGTGAVIDDPAAGLQGFFGTVEQMHRWLVPIFDRDTGAAVTGAANLVFLFLLLSGLYLWLPRLWKWRVVRNNLWFRGGLPNAKARDYNWHHVLGIWAAVPLVLIVLSGVVMSYGWANSALFGLYGETAARGRPGGAEQVETPTMSGSDQPQSYATLARFAWGAVPDADSLSLVLTPENAAETVFRLDTSPAEKAGDTLTVRVNRSTGAAMVSVPQMSAGSKVRVYMRFVHTGEVYGWVGQLVAALASLAAMVLAWTGVALAWRRLVQPVLRRRHARNA